MNTSQIQIVLFATKYYQDCKIQSRSQSRFRFRASFRCLLSSMLRLFLSFDITSTVKGAAANLLHFGQEIPDQVSSFLCRVVTIFSGLTPCMTWKFTKSTRRLWIINTFEILNECMFICIRKATFHC